MTLNRTKPCVFMLLPMHSFTGGGGAASHIARLLEDSANFHLVQPIHSQLDYAHFQHFTQIHSVPFVPLSRRTADLIGYFPSLIRCSWMIRKLMRRNQASSLILNDFYLMHGVVLRLLGYRGKIITYVRAHPRRLVGRVAAPMLWLAGLTSTRVVVVSRHIQDVLPASMPTTLIYDSLPETKSQCEPRPIWHSSDTKTLLFVGNYIEGKGQNVALEAFAKVAAQDGTLYLHFYGSDMGLDKNRAYLDGLKHRAELLGLAHRVRFEGFHANTGELLRSAYAAINASISESFSLTVLEACAAGVPVIATRSGGPQEIIVDGQTGYLVPVGDADAIAQRITELAANPERAASIGSAAKAHVAQQFSPQRQREQLLALLGLTH